MFLETKLFLGVQIATFIKVHDCAVFFSYHAVSLMEAGVSPTQACKAALSKITKYYPKFSGALVAATVSGEHGNLLFPSYRLLV